MSNYAMKVSCGCEVIAADRGARGYEYELTSCPLHGAAAEMLRLLKQITVNGADVNLSDAQRARAIRLIQKAEAKS